MGNNLHEKFTILFTQTHLISDLEKARITLFGKMIGVPELLRLVSYGYHGGSQQMELYFSLRDLHGWIECPDTMEHDDPTGDLDR